MVWKLERMVRLFKRRKVRHFPPKTSGFEPVTTGFSLVIMLKVNC